MSQLCSEAVLEKSSAGEVESELAPQGVRIRVRDLDFFYGDNQVLFSISMDIPASKVTAIIGPSGCGKSTFLRTFDRMNDEIKGARASGTVLIDGEDILCQSCDVVGLRRRVGMVFQKSNPFPKSIYDNVAYGPRVHGIRDKKRLMRIVQKSLERAWLWKDVEDRLNDNAFDLSGGQQQRLCIARALAVGPEIILMDEPASALDPTATSRIEDLIRDLRREYTIVIVTHNMQQAARVSDYTAFLYQGKLIEFGLTSDIFTKPSKKMTNDYITGRFG